MRRTQERVIRVALVYLCVIFVAVGAWATFATRSFYDSFPGGGHRWVAGDGPYNSHLVGDAGVGFLAVGAALVLAALWMEHRVIQVALIAALVHDIPHLVFHLGHPNPVVGSFDKLLIDGGIAFDVLIAAAALLLSSAAGWRRPRTPAAAAAAAGTSVAGTTRGNRP